MRRARLNWGVLGAAKIGRALAPALRDSRFARSYAVASRSLAKAQAYAREHGFEKAYGSYQALLKDPAVHVVYIPLPNHLHCAWTIRALEAGKHVLCEKPLGLRVSECKRMIAASRNNGRLLMEAFMYRFHPQTLKIQELLARGAIGEVRLIRAAFGFHLDEEAANIRLVPMMGGGSLMDVGCYCVNAMRTYFQDEPTAVFGHAERGKKTAVDTMFAGTLLFSRGRLGIFSSSFRTTLDWSVDIVGTQGRILVHSPWKPDSRLTTFVLEINGRTKRIEIRNGGGIYHREVDHFSRCILDNKPQLLPADEGLKNMRVIEALKRSALERKKIRL
jgi:D-xylose 1-dehydrogenase (NADP+, D-xylono-1,5-lactone-forming)